jgi:hypothetical protein
MLNQVVIVGNVVKLNKSNTSLTLSIILNVPVESTHPITVEIPDTLQYILDKFPLPAIIAIKGHLDSDEIGKIKVIAERISYIKSGKENDL